MTAVGTCGGGWKGGRVALGARLRPEAPHGWADAGAVVGEVCNELQDLLHHVGAFTADHVLHDWEHNWLQLRTTHQASTSFHSMREV